MLRVSVVAVSLFATLVVAAEDDRNNRARTLAREAYDALGANRFEGDHVAAAARKIEAAMQLNPKEAMAWTAASRLVWTIGYQHGDVFLHRNYEPGSVERAAELAEKAVALDPAIPQAHAQFARVLIALRRFPEAQRELAVAHKLDPEAFAPWYLQSISWWKQGNGAKSEIALKGALQRARTPIEKLAGNEQRSYIARSRGDLDEVERVHKENLALLPNDAWVHGNYAGFLEGQQRYDEAFHEWQRAAALVPYPYAVQGVERVGAIITRRKQQRAR
ncbi:MAG: tetratricopeptide repeat protein [Thermoanaerobaculia bacterium]